MDASSPRVDSTSPRVTSVEPTIHDVRGRYSVGTVIYKKFDGISYRGKIIKPFDGRYYQIEYDDGDEEEMTH